MDQLMVQVERGGSRPCGVEGESLVEVWRGGKVLVACGARPFPEGHAPFKKDMPLSRRACPLQEERAPFREGAPLLLT